MYSDCSMPSCRRRDNVIRVTNPFFLILIRADWQHLRNIVVIVYYPVPKAIAQFLLWIASISDTNAGAARPDVL